MAGLVSCAPTPPVATSTPPTPTSSGAAPASASPSPPPPSSTAPTASAQELAGQIFDHLVQLQRIADDNGGNRAIGTPGYAAAADYVEHALEAAGYVVTRDEQRIGSGIEATAALFVSGIGQFAQPMEASPDGSAEGVLRFASGGGCAPADYAAAKGEIALARRGACTISAMSDAAGTAGARGLVIINTPGGGDLTGSVDEASAPILTVGVNNDLMPTLEWLVESATPVTVTIEPAQGRWTAVNLLAEMPGNSGKVVMVGAHLDSTTDGPGINDNASGVATALTWAQRLAKEGKAAGLRFRLLGREEQGLLGSFAYLLANQQRLASIAGYVNLDMIASPTGVLGVHGTGALRSIVDEALSGQPHEEIEMAGSSDDYGFEGSGIPVVGFHAGAQPEQDACYHKACDTVSAVDTPQVRERLAILAAAGLRALPEMVKRLA